MRGVLLERYTGRPIVDPDLREALLARGLDRVAEFIEQSRLMPALVGAERNPPLYMDVNNAYSGDELGLPNRDMIGEGIIGATDLAVTAGAGNSVNIAAGSAWVLGDTNPALQPNYRVYNDAVVNLGVSPDPTNPRRVLVGAAITDQAFAGSGRLWALQAIHGTPAASPVVPATPASFLPLADVLVPAAAASSAAYTFTDLRSRARVGGGQALGPSTDLTKIIDYTVAGASVASIDTNNALGSWAGGSLPQTYSSLLVFLKVRGTTAALQTGLAFTVNNDAGGTSYDKQLSYLGAAVTTVGNSNGWAVGPIDLASGAMSAGTALANSFDSLIMELPSYRDALHKRVHWRISMEGDGTATNSYNMHGNLRWRATAAITRLAWAAVAGNLDIGTRLLVFGLN